MCCSTKVDQNQLSHVCNSGRHISKCRGLHGRLVISRRCELFFGGTRRQQTWSVKGKRARPADKAEDCASEDPLLLSTVALYESGAQIPNTRDAATVRTVHAQLNTKVRKLSGGAALCRRGERVVGLGDVGEEPVAGVVGAGVVGAGVVGAGVVGAGVVGGPGTGFWFMISLSNSPSSGYHGGLGNVSRKLDLHANSYTTLERLNLDENDELEYLGVEVEGSISLIAEVRCTRDYQRRGRGRGLQDREFKEKHGAERG